MYQILRPVGDFNRSPFQYPKQTFLSERMNANLAAYYNAIERSGRIDSNHLLMNILSNLATKFTGDLHRYMSDCESAANRMIGSLKMTSAVSRGHLFTEGVFYNGCPEIIVSVRDPNVTVMDLWKDWREVEPIRIVMHPITSTVLVPLCSTSPMQIQHPGLAIIQIDIPLLAGQYVMWRASHPDEMMERFLLGYPLARALRSHLDVAMFNVLAAKLGVKPWCSVNDVLNIQQSPTDQYVGPLMDEVIAKVSSTGMSPNKVLSSIPVLTGNYLERVGLPDMLPNYQCLWATITQRTEPFAVVMEFCKQFGYDKAVHEITIAKRTTIDIESSKLFSNGLTSATTVLLDELYSQCVTERLPT